MHKISSSIRESLERVINFNDLIVFSRYNY